MTTATMRRATIGALLAATMLGACSDDSSDSSSDEPTDAVTDAPTGESSDDSSSGQSTEYVVQTGTTQLGAQVCDPNNHCLGTATWQSAVTGDWKGSLIGAGPAAVAPEDPLGAYASTSVLIFSGSIEGCGEGSVVLRTAGSFDDPDLDEVWEIVPGFSTGELVDISGEGSTTGTRNPDLSYDSTSVGEVVCEDSSASAAESGGDGEPAFTLTGPGITPGESVCDDQDRCITPYSVSETVAGTWTGTTVIAGAVVAGETPTEFAGGGTLIFEGTVEGCGSGTAVVRRAETGGDELGDFSGTWEIVSGYGTGDLTELSGAGTIAQAEGEAVGSSAFFGDAGCG